MVRFFIQYNRITVLQLYSLTELHKNIFHNSNTFFIFFLFYLIFICIFAKEKMLEQSLLTVFCTFQPILYSFRSKAIFQVKLNTLFFFKFFEEFLHFFCTFSKYRLFIIRKKYERVPKIRLEKYM